MTERDLPSWIHSEHGPTFARKTFGRVFVHSAADAERVLAIARTISEDEVDTYMPKDAFVSVWTGPDDARLLYGHKFELRIDLLEYHCFVAGIPVLIVTGVSHD